MTMTRTEKLKVQNILVPIDFSKMSLGALEVATDLAQRLGATVHLGNVSEYYYPADDMILVEAIPIPVRSSIDEAKEEGLRHLRELAKEHGCTGSCQVRVGGPVFNEIALLAQELEADLIVSATHGYAGWKHLVLGSNAERIVQHAPCPVYVARAPQAKGRRSRILPPKAEQISKIMVPVDFSECALEGLKYAIAFADRIAARIIVVNVVYQNPAFTADEFAVYNLYPLEEAARQRAEKEMSRFIDQVEFGEVPYATEVKIGPPVQTLATFAEERQVQLIITATHGRTGFSHVMLGSTAERVVRHAPCSVLTVPSHPGVRERQLELTSVAP
jgi:nucleotide-binding universal stress UspA family protein